MIQANYKFISKSACVDPDLKNANKITYLFKLFRDKHAQSPEICKSNLLQNVKYTNYISIYRPKLRLKSLH